MYFEDMGITYIGPIDGHNVPLMVDTLNRAKRLDEPIIIHVVTKKGKGYRPAEPESSQISRNQSIFLKDRGSFKEIGQSIEHSGIFRYTDQRGEER